MIPGLKPKPPRSDPARARRRRVVGSVVAASIVVHLVGGGLAGVWVVARYFSPPPAKFEMKKEVKLPAKERDHRMDMAKYDALTPKPSLNEKLASLRPTDFALPDLPEVPLDQMLPLDPAALVSDQVSGMVGAAGLGGGGQGAGGMGGGGDGVSFFGIKSQGRRIVLLFDVATSVVNKAENSGVPLAEIQRKTVELVDNLGIGSLFNLVQFTRNYNLFQQELVPSTDANKEAARSWIAREWTSRGSLPSNSKKVVLNPSGILGVLERALEMDPDAIFLISDGSFERTDTSGGNSYGVGVKPNEIENVLDHYERQTGRQVPVNFIGFQMKEDDRRSLRRIFRRTGGTFREING